MPSEVLKGFYLGDFLVEPLKGQVTGRSGSLHLAPKAMEVLRCLVESPDDVVTREVLLDDVWGPGAGSAEALSHAVSEIRHVLEDSATNPHYIQTLPKRGYRLLVEPVLVGDSTSSVVLGAEDGARITDIGFLENLRQRGVFETGLAYILVGWLLIQAADIVFKRLLLPDWTVTFVTVLVIAGLPIALVLSWYLEFRDGRAVVDRRSPADARRSRFSRTYMSVIAALTIAGVMVSAYEWSIGLPRAELTESQTAALNLVLPPIVENSFAVLPFLNLDGSDETRLFADGLVDDIITQLSRVPGLRVASRGDSFSLEPNSPSQAVRDRLRVETYLEGSVEMNDERMRVKIKMIDSEDGFNELAREFEQLREDFFEIRNEITKLIVANVRVALPPGMQTAPHIITDDPSLDAYVLYRRGIDAFWRPTTIDAIYTALGWFDAALDVDPGYAAAHAGKCATYVDGYKEVDDASFIAEAQLACATALSLNPNLNIVYTALGDLYQSTGRHDDAEAAYQQALSIDPKNVAALTGLGRTYTRLKQPDKAEASLWKAVSTHPGNASAYSNLGTFLFRSGRFDEAAEQYEYVVALQPENMHGYDNLASAYMMMDDYAAAAPAFQLAIEIEPTKNAYSNLGLMHYYLGDYDAAIDSLTNAVDLQPNDYLARMNLGDALWVAGRSAESFEAFATAETRALSAFDVNPNDPFIMMDLAWIRAMLDRPADARSLIDQARRLAPDDPYTHYIDGLVHLKAGDFDAALSALRRAADMGYSRQMLASEPHLAPIRNDPRFSAILNSG